MKRRPGVCTAHGPESRAGGSSSEGRARVTNRYFQRVRWLHDNREDPVVLWSEIVDGWETRKVDEFADGRLVWADEAHEFGETRLGTVPVPAPAEIAQDPQFVVELVDASAFQAVWRAAHDAPPAEPTG